MTVVGFCTPRRRPRCSPWPDPLFAGGGVDVLWWLALKEGDEVKQPA